MENFGNDMYFFQYHFHPHVVQGIVEGCRKMALLFDGQIGHLC